MLKYNGYLIITEPDYKEATAKGEVVDDLLCQVYDENDTDRKHMLGDFNLVRGASFNESSAKAIERAIMEVVEEDQTAFELVRKTNELNHLKELFGNAVAYIKETVGGWEYAENVLRETVGMTDEEIESFYGILQENVEEGMKMQ